jgi:hypothetical protein
LWIAETPHSAQTNKNEEKCVFYSIGSANSWGFEEEVLETTNCRVHEFPVMISSVNSGLRLPLQIAMELHLEQWENDREVFDHRVNSLELYHLLLRLNPLPLQRVLKPHCPHCTKLVLTKLDCRNFPLQRQYQQMFLNVSQ